MQKVNIHEAKTQFSRLVDAAANGEEIIIAKAGKPQYSSLNDPDGFFDVDRLKGLGVTRSQREVAHLTLDPAWIAAAALGEDALLQYLLQHARMKLFAPPRGE